MVMWRMAKNKQYVYFYGHGKENTEGDTTMKALLGGEFNDGLAILDRGGHGLRVGEQASVVRREPPVH